MNYESCTNVCLMQIQGFYVRKGYVMYWVCIKGLNSGGNFFYYTKKTQFVFFLWLISVDRISVLPYPLKLKI